MHGDKRWSYHLNFNLKQLEAFVWVSDLGSFRRAAERLNTTQPNISSRIASLETALNVSLMERDAGSVRLTTKGQDLLEHARQVLQSAEQLVEAADVGAMYDGVLRLGVTEMVVHTWLREFQRVLKEQFPNIAVELTVDMSVNIEKELFARSIDLAFQSEPFSRSTTGAIDLGTYEQIWVAAKSCALVQAKQVDTAMLASYPVLTHARGTRPYEQIAAHFRQHQHLSARLVPSSNLAACVHMSADGMGVASVPSAMVSRELTNGELARVPYNWAPEDLHFFARYDAERSPHYVLKAAQLAGEISNAFNQSGI
ncbi:MAG: LysR family transcriptional regulator [Granulosicoccus sp.]|nr:LysR family transcriptional regulator [Granulosicoccus sp.]